MALTYLNSIMIELPAHIERLSTSTLSVGNFVGNFTSTQNLSTNEISTNEINFPAAGGSIYNNTNLYGNLTITGSITALSGLQIIPTTFSNTSALSVVNTGAGTPLFVSQEVPGLNSVLEVKGTGVSILKVNNSSPDNFQTGVEINYPKNGPSLRVSNNSGSSVFVVTSSNRVGINTNLPVSELQVIGRTTTSDLSSAIGTITSLSSNTVNSNTIQSTILNVDSFKTTQTVANSSFNTVLTADQGRINTITANTVVTNNLNALSAVINVLDVKVYEMSGFNIDGPLTVTQGITANTLSATRLNVGQGIGDFQGNFLGGDFNGTFYGSSFTNGSFTGLVRMDPNAPGGGVPALSTSAGDSGVITFDSDYLYVCVATNTWKRVALSAWN